MFKKTVIFLIVVFVSLQFIPVHKNNPKINPQIALQTNPDVMKILKKSCYDCHSYETKYPPLFKIAPFSFVIAQHIEDGRGALNFSTYKTIPNEIKKERLRRAISMINLGTMPLPSYLLLHKEAKLSKEEKTILTKWFKKELSQISDN